MIIVYKQYVQGATTLNKDILSLKYNFIPPFILFD